MANKGKPFSDNDVDHPRITFQAPGRIFDRLLKESSLSDLKETVRKKLGLRSTSVIQFTQLCNGQFVDLKNEDDFDAFHAVAYKHCHAMVQVVLTENTATEEGSVDAKSSTPPLFLTPANALPVTKCLNANLSAFVPGGATSHQKVVLKNEDSIEVNLETLKTKVSPTPLTPSVTTRQNLPATPSSKTAPIRTETPEQLQKRLEKEEQKEKETKTKASVEERGKRKEEEEKAKTQTPKVEDAAETREQAKEDELTQEPEKGELHPSKDDAKERRMKTLRIDTPLSDERRPGPLDLSDIRPPPSLLALARPLGNLDSITYPEGIRSPKPELNIGAKEGKFRYDRDFLMQFMSLCKEKPDSLPPLDAIGLEPVDPLSLTRGGSGRHRQLSGTSAPSRQASIGGGLPGAALRGQFQSMGSFTTTPSKFGQSERFEAPGNRSVSMSGPTMPFRNPPLQRTASQGGVGPMQSHRTRSKRGEKRSDASKVSAGPQAHGPTYSQPYGTSQAPNFEPIAPLQMTENRWDRKSFHNNDPDSPEVVDRKVKALLNKLTMEKFDSISDQIIQWANRSENQKDGRTLIQVIRLVFERTKDEAMWSEMYARLCRKMMEQISPKVQDEGIRNSEGNPITGGQLFRKYLLNRCQEDFERGWFAKEAATKAANEKNESGEVAPHSDEYYAAQKAKRQGLGLIKFIGELFKLKMLTERIMHECIKRLLGNMQNPEEEEIESLCMLLTTVGSLLDNQKARAHLDIYFQRMQEISKNVSPQMQFILNDLIELRDRKWQAQNADAGPTTIAQIHKAAAKEKADEEKEATQPRMSTSRGGSRRGGTRDDYPQTDGWNSVSPPFGRSSKAQPPTTLRPGSLVAGKEELEREAISRTSSSSNMFTAQEAQQESNKAAEQPLQRKKLVLQPHTKPVEDPTPSPEEYPKADRWNNVSPAAAQANDLSQFGRFSKAHRSPTTLGSDSLFAGKEELEREAISRTSSSPNTFTAQEVQQEFTKAAEQPLQCKKLVLQTHAKPVEDPIPAPEEYPKANQWNNVPRAAAQANDLSQFSRSSKAQSPITLGPGSLFAGKEELEREAISRTSSSPNTFTAQEVQQESNKASEQPIKPVEEPPVPAFFSIRNLFVTFLQSMYTVPEDDPGTLI